MYSISRRAVFSVPRVLNAVVTRSFGGTFLFANRYLLVKFTIKSFVDEYTTEEVEVEAEEGKTILEVAQDYGASINCNSFCDNMLSSSFLWWKLSLRRLSHQVGSANYRYHSSTF